MNVGELKAELKNYPDDMPVCVDNIDIYFVDPKPAYWDGVLQRLVIDESKKPYYCVVGGKFTTKGSKLNLSTMSIKDHLLDFPDSPVEFDMGGSCEEKVQAYREMVDRWRAEIRQIMAEIEAEERNKKEKQENEKD